MLVIDLSFPQGQLPSQVQLPTACSSDAHLMSKRLLREEGLMEPETNYRRLMNG